MSIGYRPPIPSSLMSERSKDDFNYQKDIRSNLTIKVGIVIDVIEIDSPNNATKLSTEYTVMTIESFNNKTYSNCLAADGFGGIADFFNQKLRPVSDKKKAANKTELKGQNGSIVLMMCLDGLADQAVIIGSIAHPDRKNGKLTKELGHHMEGEFNGVNWKVDKDGALTVTFKSATDNDGKQADTKAAGSNLKMEKDGSIEVGDGNKEKIRIDKTAKTVAISAEADISATTDAGVNLTAKAGINLKATADLLADAGGSFTAKSGGAFNITSEGPLSMKATDIKIAADNMMTLKGSQIMISAPMINVGDGGTPAVTMNTLVMAVGNLGIPIIGNLVGPFSSSVFIGS